MIHAQALGHKGTTPDQGSDQHQDIGTVMAQVHASKLGRQNRHYPRDRGIAARYSCLHRLYRYNMALTETPLTGSLSVLVSANNKNDCQDA
ncbi:hypothetical protein YSKK_12460 [Halopseudomonas aestusnigri]|nr:hypothetical protein YSKK_12460 [Halopseudomonas aestusnigri]